MANSHVASVRQLGAIWLVLMVLTGITIVLSRLDLGYLNIAAALGLATVKASLVALFFMHLRYESRALQGMVLFTLLLLVMFIWFIFFDVTARY